MIVHEATHRFFWKEYRTLRAIWLAMVGLAVVIMVAPYAASLGEIRLPLVFLFSVTLSVTACYAAGCGAAMFANEHEEGGSTHLEPASPNHGPRADASGQVSDRCGHSVDLEPLA